MKYLKFTFVLFAAALFSGVIGPGTLHFAAALSLEDIDELDRRDESESYCW
jgi:hypothetical protein